MKNCFFFFFLFLSFTLNAQRTVFVSEVNINDLKSSEKISNDYYKMSSKLVYRTQSPFEFQQDLRIPLLDGNTIIAKYTSSSTLKVGSVSYIYRIENDREGLVVFTVYKNFLVGAVMLGTGEKFHISQVTPSLFSFLKFNPNYFTNEDCVSNNTSTDNNELLTDRIKTDGDQEMEQESTTAYNVCTDAPCPNSVVDVMVFFSNQTIASLKGGEIEAVAGTSNQIVIGNQGYISSGITNLQLNLVYARALNYNDDPTDISNDKANIKYNTTIQALRNQYGADLVSIFTNHGSGVGDQPKNPTSFSSDAAYSAINYGYVIGYYSFLHETGHNLGIRHDWYEYKSDAADIADGKRPCSWHHGFSNQAAILLGTSSAENRRWRTILSYGGHFGSVGVSSFRINRWSNPALLYTGDPMGIDASASEFPSNEKFALERTGCKVAGFRTSIVTGTCPETPTGLSSQTVCTSSNFTAINVTGTSIQWYYGPSLGTPIVSTAKVVAGTYYASQTLNGCESPRLAVVVSIGSCVTLSGTISGNATICAGIPTQLSIALTGQGPWSGTLSDGSSFSGTVSPLAINRSPIVNTTYTIASLSNGNTTATPGHLVGKAVILIKESPRLTTITASSPTTLCQGGRVDLTVSAQTSSYIVTNKSDIGFIDIATSGLSVGTLADESKHFISIPKFLYNGIAYTSATVFNNGVLVFGNETGNMGFDNVSLPSALATLTNPAAICALWDNLFPGSGTSIKTATINNKFIIQWTNEYHFNFKTSGTVTFQIQLDILSGQIHLVYPDILYGNSVIDNGRTATIGLNLTAITGLQYSWSSPSIANNQSITYSPYTIGWSSGQSTPSISVSSTGNYTVTVTNSAGCSATSVVSAITVNPIPPTPTITASGVTTFCAGGNVELASSSSVGNQWYKDNLIIIGATNQKLTATASGIYKSVVTTGGCSSVSSAGTLVTVNPVPSAPTISTLGIKSFCQGDSVIFSASESSNYLWKNGSTVLGTTQRISVYSIGSYSVSIQSTSACTNTSDTTHVAAPGTKPNAITLYPIPITPTIGRDANNFLVSTASYGNRWYKDGLLMPDTSKNIKPIENGSYTVKTLQNGCVSEKSNVYYFLVNNVISLPDNQFVNVSPNPFVDNVVITFSLLGYSKLNLQVFDFFLGRKLLEKNNIYSGMNLRMDNLSKGAFIFSISSADNKYCYRFKILKL